MATASPKVITPTSSNGYGDIMDRIALQFARKKVIILTVLIGFVGLFLVIRGPPGSRDASATTTMLSGDWEYIVVIDAGSSGSRAHVFHHKDGKVEPKHDSFKSRPGLSSYAKDPIEAGRSLQPLLDFAEEKIPPEKIEETPILLKATAGMRLLPSEQRSAVMKDVTTYLQNSGFLFAGATVIPGSEEGLLGWMAVNYLNSNQHHDKNNDGEWGVLEMGGASLQVTLPLSPAAVTTEEEEIPTELQQTYHSPHKGGKSGRVFTHSFLGLGLNSARESVNQVLQSSPKDPCLQTGYLPDGPNKTPLSGVPAVAIPQGNFDECLQLVTDSLFPQSECQYTKGHCFYNGLYKPTMSSSSSSSIKLWAFENFFYLPSGAGLDHVPGTTTPAKLAALAKDVCAMSWDDIKANFPKDDQPTEFNENYCFGLTYAYAFYTKGMGLQPNQQITVGNDVGDIGIDWALGAALQTVQEQETAYKKAAKAAATPLKKKRLLRTTSY